MSMLWSLRSLEQCIKHQRFLFSLKCCVKNNGFSFDSIKQITIGPSEKLCHRSYSKDHSSKLVIDNRIKTEEAERKRKELAEAKARGTMGRIGFVLKAFGMMAFLCFCVIFACTATSAWDPGFRRRLRKYYPWFASWTDLVLEKEVEEEEAVLGDVSKQEAAAEYRKQMVKHLRDESK